MDYIKVAGKYIDLEAVKRVKFEVDPQAGPDSRDMRVTFKFLDGDTFVSDHPLWVAIVRDYFSSTRRAATIPLETLPLGSPLF